MAMPAFPLNLEPLSPAQFHRGDLVQRAIEAEDRLAAVQARHENDDEWIAFARRLLDASEAVRQGTRQLFRDRASEWEQWQQAVEAYLAAITPSLADEDLPLALRWSTLVTAGAQLTAVDQSLVAALLGDTEGIPESTLERARKLQFQAAKQDVFERHDGLLRRLA